MGCASSQESNLQPSVKKVDKKIEETDQISRSTGL